MQPCANTPGLAASGTPENRRMQAGVSVSVRQCNFNPAGDRHFNWLPTLSNRLGLRSPQIAARRCLVGAGRTMFPPPPALAFRFPRLYGIRRRERRDADKKTLAAPAPGCPAASRRTIANRSLYDEVKLRK